MKNDRAVEDCVALLEMLRIVYRGQLDTRVAEEIDVVVAALEEHRCQDSEAGRTMVEWTPVVLKLIAEVLRVVTNISDLIG